MLFAVAPSSTVGNVTLIEAVPALLPVTRDVGVTVAANDVAIPIVIATVRASTTAINFLIFFIFPFLSFPSRLSLLLSQ